MAAPIPQLPAAEPTYDPSRPLAKVDVLSNVAIPGSAKSVVSYLITLPPNGSTPPHRHAGAFVSAYMLSGYKLNAMDDKPMQLLGPDENFQEHPQCFHRISDNASTTEPAAFVATLVIDTKTVDELGVHGLTVIEDKYLQMIADAQAPKDS